MVSHSKLSGLEPKQLPDRNPGERSLNCIPRRESPVNEEPAISDSGPSEEVAIADTMPRDDDTSGLSQVSVPTSVALRTGDQDFQEAVEQPTGTNSSGLFLSSTPSQQDNILEVSGLPRASALESTPKRPQVSSNASSPVSTPHTPLPNLQGGGEDDMVEGPPRKKTATSVVSPTSPSSIPPLGLAQVIVDSGDENSEKSSSSTPKLSIPRRGKKAVTKAKGLLTQKEALSEKLAAAWVAKLQSSEKVRKSERRSAFQGSFTQECSDNEEDAEEEDDSDVNVVFKTELEERMKKKADKTAAEYLARRRESQREKRVREKKEKEVERYVIKCEKIKEKEDKADLKKILKQFRETLAQQKEQDRVNKLEIIRRDTQERNRKRDARLYTKLRTETSNSYLAAIRTAILNHPEFQSTKELFSQEEPVYLMSQIPSLVPIDRFNLQEFPSQYFLDLNRVFRDYSPSNLSNVFQFAQLAANLAKNYYFGSTKDPYYDARGYRDQWHYVRHIMNVFGESDQNLETDPADDVRKADLWRPEDQNSREIGFKKLQKIGIVENLANQMGVSLLRQMETFEVKDSIDGLEKRSLKMEYFVDKFLLLIKTWWNKLRFEGMMNRPGSTVQNYPRVIQYFFHILEVMWKHIYLDTTTLVFKDVIKVDEKDRPQFVKRMLFWLPIHLGDLVGKQHVPRKELVDLARQLFAVLLDEWQLVMGVTPDERDLLERLQLAALRLECINTPRPNKIADWLPYWKSVDPRGLFGAEKELKKTNPVPKRRSRRRSRSFHEFTFTEEHSSESRPVSFAILENDWKWMEKFEEEKNIKYKRNYELVVLK